MLKPVSTLVFLLFGHQCKADLPLWGWFPQTCSDMARVSVKSVKPAAHLYMRDHEEGVGSGSVIDDGEHLSFVYIDVFTKR